MMRLTRSIAGLASLIAAAVLWLPAPALAEDFPDVPTDHWAYEAVDYLQSEGLVEGYPDGYFKGNRSLTRYEFAMVIARLYGTLVAQEDLSKDIEIIYDRLDNEFRPELDEIQAQLRDHDSRLVLLEDSFGDLEGRVAQNEEDIDTIFGRLGNIKLSGDARLRYEYTTFDQPGVDRMQRARLMWHVKGEADVNDDVKATFRIASGGAGAIADTNENLEDNFAQDGFDLDQAYLTYHSDGGMGGFKVDAGRFPANWVKTRMTHDEDVMFEGLGESFFVDGEHWRVNLAQLLPAEAGYYLVNQVGYEGLMDALDLYATYHFVDDKAFSLIRDDVANSRFFNQMTYADIARDSNFSQWELLGQLHLDELFGNDGDYPLVLTGNYGEGSYDASATSSEVLTKAGYASLLGGELLEEGDWQWELEAAIVQSNSTPFTPDLDRGGTNTEYFTAAVFYQWLEDVALGVTYIDQQQHNPSSSPNGYSCIQVDAVAKF